jgi:hypothetical protein
MILLGTGPDGHCGCLFPDSPEIKASGSGKIVLAGNDERANGDFMAVSLDFMNAAKVRATPGPPPFCPLPAPPPHHTHHTQTPFLLAGNDERANGDFIAVSPDLMNAAKAIAAPAPRPLPAPRHNHHQTSQTRTDRHTHTFLLAKNVREPRSPQSLLHFAPFSL